MESGGHYVLTDTKSVLTNRLAVHTGVCVEPRNGTGTFSSREGGDPSRRLFCVHNRGSEVSVPRVTCNDLEKDQTQGKYAVTTRAQSPGRPDTRSRLGHSHQTDQIHGHD